jgi:hypothetical protein
MVDAMDDSGRASESPPSVRPHRPVPLRDLTALIDAAGGQEFSSRAETAQATAATVLAAGRAGTDASYLVTLADRVGLDTLAALWRDAEPVSLPGALWALYLLRQWCQTRPEQVRRIWRYGAPHAVADAVVAGCADDVDEPTLQRTADNILAGVYQGDVGVAFDRGAAFFRVIAAGRRDVAADPTEVWFDAEAGRADARDLAARNEVTAGHLARAAREWRAGTLG